MRGMATRLLLPNLLLLASCNAMPYFGKEPVNWECGIPDAETGA